MPIPFPQPDRDDILVMTMRSDEPSRSEVQQVDQDADGGNLGESITRHLLLQRACARAVAA